MVHSKKYLAVVAAILIGIAAVILVVSQFYASPKNVPFTKGPTSEPHVTPPTTPPPGAK